MNILWITNIVFPEAQALLTGDGDLKASGGWMVGAAEALTTLPGVSLAVATVSNKVKTIQRLDGERIVYYLLPYGKGNDRYNKEYEPLWKKVRDEVNPNVVHIHGSEFTHGLAYVRACGAENVVVSIQGLVSICAKYYHTGISKEQIYRNFTLRSVLGRSILSEKGLFEKRGILERELLKSVHHIIGRTTWDKTHIWAINPKANYYHVDETLRKVFYDGKWDYMKCKPHSIFLSQGNYPLKGLHMVLKALPLVRRDYPDVTLRLAGNDITQCNSVRAFVNYTNYGRIIKQLIKELELEDVVTFTGPLDAEDMKMEYLKSNVFVCPSSIENSPNSLGEAQILGVPVVATYAGGIPDMMVGDEEHLYRFEETEMLASRICRIFESEGNQPNVENMRAKAFRRHDSEANCANLLNAYKLIVESED